MSDKPNEMAKPLRLAALTHTVLEKCQGIEASTEELMQAFALASTTIEKSIHIDMMRAAVNKAINK